MASDAISASGTVRRLFCLKTQCNRSEEWRFSVGWQQIKEGPFAYIAAQGSAYPSIKVFPAWATERCFAAATRSMPQCM
jgi:hypothetical protein